MTDKAAFPEQVQAGKVRMPFGKISFQELAIPGGPASEGAPRLLKCLLSDITPSSRSLVLSGDTPVGMSTGVSGWSVVGLTGDQGLHEAVPPRTSRGI